MFSGILTQVVSSCQLTSAGAGWGFCGGWQIFGNRHYFVWAPSGRTRAQATLVKDDPPPPPVAEGTVFKSHPQLCWHACLSAEAPVSGVDRSQSAAWATTRPAVSRPVVSRPHCGATWCFFVSRGFHSDASGVMRQNLRVFCKKKLWNLKHISAEIIPTNEIGFDQYIIFYGIGRHPRGSKLSHSPSHPSPTPRLAWNDLLRNLCFIDQHTSQGKWKNVHQYSSAMSRVSFLIFPRSFQSKTPPSLI